MATSLMRTALAAMILGVTGTLAISQQLEVEIIERSAGNLDTCALGQVVGLKSDGDGFLSVRSGPGTQFTKLDEIHNGDRVWMFEQRGKWIGVVYGVEEFSCSPIAVDRPVDTYGRKGWVHQNWIQIIAG